MKTLAQFNWRDLGGIPLGSRLRLKERTLYRGEAPSQFGETARAELATMRPKLVLDLRSDDERRAPAVGWDNTTRLMKLDLPNDFADESSLGYRRLLDDFSVENARAAMKVSYAAMPARLHSHLSAVVESIIAEGGPIYIHCTAGKDRTGVLVALLLLFLGAPLDLVTEDYLRSTIYAETMRRHLVSGRGHHFGGLADHPDVFRVLVGVDAGFLRAALTATELQWGSVDAYFNSAGVDGARRSRLLATFAAPMS